MIKKDLTNQDKILITRGGLERIKAEYQKLVKEKRPVAVRRLAETRELGELSEDNDYTLAKQELAFIDGRIAELGEVISKATLIDEGHDACEEIRVGCKVIVREKKNEHTFHLVGEWEADPMEKKISHQSPLGRALLGKRVREKVEIEAPAGKIIYTIKAID